MLKKFMINRRSVLKAIPAAPAVAHKAAQHAIANPTIIDMTGLGTTGREATEDQSFGGMLRERSKKRKVLMRIFKQFGVPEWKRRDIERSVSYVRSIDPDIACLQSVSLVHKLRMQHERMAKRQLSDEFDSLTRGEIRDAWMKAMGMDDDDYY